MIGLDTLEEFVKSTQEIAHELHFIAHELHLLNDVMASKQGMQVKPNLTKEEQVKPNLTKEEQVKPNLTKEEQVKPNLTKEEKEALYKHHIEMGNFFMRMAGVEPNF